jgi:predicted transposase YdaD
VREEGVAKGILQTAETMKATGFSVEDIIKATNITVDEIRRL